MRLKSKRIALGGDVFILGAGFSHAINPAMPLMKTLSSKLGSVTTSGGVPYLEEDFELGLTYLSEGHPGMSEPTRLRNRAKFLEITEELSSLLEAATEEALNASACEWLLKLVHYMHDQRVTVLTLNYDTLVEATFKKIRVWDYSENFDEHFDIRAILALELQDSAGAFGLDRMSSATLLKLHGSTNWFYSGSDSYFGEAIYSRRLPGKVPLLLPPVAQKSTYFRNELVRGQWSLAADALSSASRVFCIGYSLPPTDLTFRFLLNALEDRRLDFYVVDCATERADHFASYLPKGPDVKRDFCGGADCIERLVGMLEQEICSQPGAAMVPTSFPYQGQLRDQGITSGAKIPEICRHSDVFSIELFDDHGLVIRDDRNIVCRIPWTCFNAVYSKIEEEVRAPNNGSRTCTINTLDPYVIDMMPRRIARPILTLLERLGKVRYSLEHGAELIGLPGVGPEVSY